MKSALSIAAAAFLLSGVAGAAEIKVLSTQATEEAYKELVPQFEKASGHKVTTVFTGTLDALKRLSNGETYDLLIMARQQIDELSQSGKVVAGSRTDIAKSGVGAAVGKGKPKPDISTVDALKKTLLAAKSIGYSTGPSGIYVVTMFQKMGIADEVKSKLKQTPTGVFDRLPAGERAQLLSRHRLRRTNTRRSSADHGLLRRNSNRNEASRCRQGAGELRHRAGSRSHLQEARARSRLIGGAPARHSDASKAKADCRS
jgi:ABC-type molybdate transport system substrate-binding protein